MYKKSSAVVQAFRVVVSCDMGGFFSRCSERFAVKNPATQTRSLKGSVECMKIVHNKMHLFLDELSSSQYEIVEVYTSRSPS